MKSSIFERLKELEKKRNRLHKFYEEMKAYKYLCLSKSPAKNKDFWEQDERSKRVTGMPQIIDLPDGEELKALVLKAISEKEKAIEAEFNELIK